MIGVNLKTAAAAIGMSSPGLLKHSRVGNCTRESDGSFIVEKIREELGRNTDIRQQRTRPARVEQSGESEYVRKVVESSGKLRKEPAPELSPVVEEPKAEVTATVTRGGIGEPAPDSYKAATTQLEWLKVEKAKLEQRIRRGELVEIGPVDEFVSSMIIGVREDLLRMGPELREILAYETDPVKIQEILEQRIRKALKGLSSYRGSLADKAA